jgi:hypothetical protein
LQTDLAKHFGPGVRPNLVQGKTMSEDDCRLMMLGTLTVFFWSVIAIMHWFVPSGSEQTSVPHLHSEAKDAATLE